MLGRTPLGGPTILLALLLLQWLGAGSAMAASERQLKEAELRQLRERIATLQQEMNQVRGQYDRLQQELRQSEQRINRIGRAIHELDGSFQQTEQRISTLRSYQQSLRGDMSGQREQLARQVRAAYAMGRQETLKILLNQENPATVGRVMTYYDYLNQARSQQIARIADTLAELRQTAVQLEREQAHLQQLRHEQEREQQALAASREQRLQVLVRLADELQDQDRRLGAMQQDEQQLARLIQALVEALEDIPKEIGSQQAFASLRGQMSMPTRGAVLASFGSSRNPGGLSWQGIRISAPEGQEVRAVSHGRVAFADWLRGYGLLIIIEHGDGYMSLYGHNQSLFKEVGDWVARNEVIASVGSHAADNRSALYFEIRKDGRPLDPIRWVKR